MQIDVAQSTDLPAIAALVNCGYRGDASRAGWTTEADFFEGERTNEAALAEQLAAGPGRLMLTMRAEAGAPIEGCVYLQGGYGAGSRGCYLGMLTVRPGTQARGLGRLLLAAAETKARELGASVMHLCVLSPRTELMDWYERRGYRRTGETRPFSYENAAREKPKRLDLEFLYFAKEL